ncbi:MAG: hypothetical protein GC180_12200 [Bacteroidetes bacterium]|nr:hypothetical protein [Bacteroidota bacterium]
MKKLMLAAMAVVSSSLLFGQEIPANKIPAEVKAAFQSKFPNAEKVKWEMEEGYYDAEFKQKGTEMSAEFSAKGEWIETEMEIKSSQLPKAVQDQIKAAYPGYEIDHAMQVESAKFGNCFEVEMEKGSTEINVHYSADGKTLETGAPREKHKMKEELEDKMKEHHQEKH